MPDPEENSEERDLRHAIQVRTQYATVEALENLTKLVERTRSDVSEMKGWFMGVPQSDGTLKPGVLQTVSIVRGAHRWIVGLLATATTAIVMQCLHTFFPHIFGSH